jgi:hypothetical protein
MMILGLSAAFEVSYGLLWFVVAVFGLLIVLLYRQFGLAFMRPLDRASMQGLDVGSKAPEFSLTVGRNRSHEIRFGPNADGGGSTVVIFAMPSCTICEGLAKTLASLPADLPSARFVWVDGSARQRIRRGVDDVDGWIAGTAEGDVVHRQWEVSAVPFCFVIDPAGRISDKRLVNQRRDVELALGAPLRDVPTIAVSA